MTPEDYLRLRALYGLDDPLYIRYFKWLWQVVQLNPGYSQEYHRPIMDLVAPRLWNTLLLSLAALIVGKLLAILFGIYSATHQYSPGDYATMALALFGFSVPGFWLGLMLIYVFALVLRWLPPSGFVSLTAGVPDNIRSLEGALIRVVAFHSLEDARVQSFLRQRSGGLAGGSRHSPPPPDAPPPSFTLLTRRAIRPEADEMSRNPRARSAKLRAAERDIAFVFQLFALYPHLTAYENIAFPLRATNESKTLVDQRVREVAKALRIDHLLLNPSLAGRLVASNVDRTVRGWEKASDHAPTWVELRD